MKKEGHPAYQDILFVDTATGHKFVCGSTLQPKETEEFEGKTYPVYRVPISSSSHPFFTGSQQFVDSEGRVDKFKKRYTSSATPLVDPKKAKKEALQKASTEAKEKAGKDSKDQEESKEEKKKPAAKKAVAKKPAAKKAPAKKAAAPKAAKKEEKAEDKKSSE